MDPADIIPAEDVNADDLAGPPTVALTAVPDEPEPLPGAVSGVVLGRGVEIRLLKVRTVTDIDQTVTHERLQTKTGAFLAETRWLRFSNNVMARIEHRWGSQDAWQQAMNDSPFATTRATLAIVFDLDDEAAGEAMFDGATARYSAAIQSAWMLANGIDPKRVGRFCRKAIEAADQQLEMQSQVMETEVTGKIDEMLDNVKTALERRQSASTKHGSEQTEIPNSSGL